MIYLKDADDATLACEVIDNEKMWDDSLKNLPGFKETVIADLKLIEDAFNEATAASLLFSLIAVLVFLTVDCKLLFAALLRSLRAAETRISFIDAVIFAKTVLLLFRTS